jgi:hypothetical protein
VVVHSEWAATRQVLGDTLARRVKNVDDYFEFYEGNIDILYE